METAQVMCVASRPLTATFQRVYVFVILDVATRRIVHWNLTRHPTAAWTIQQFRNGLPADGTHRMLVHDRDASGRFGSGLDVTSRAEDTGSRSSSPCPRRAGLCDRSR